MNKKNAKPRFCYDGRGAETSNLRARIGLGRARDVARGPGDLGFARTEVERRHRTFESRIGLGRARDVARGPGDLGSATTGVERRHRTFESRIGLEKMRMILTYHPHFSERETGIEPATPSLARRCSTAEPLAHKSYRHYTCIRKV